MPHSLPPGVLLAFDFLQIISSEKDTAFEGPGMRRSIGEILMELTSFGRSTLVEMGNLKKSGRSSKDGVNIPVEANMVTKREEFLGMRNSRSIQLE